MQVRLVQFGATTDSDENLVTVERLVTQALDGAAGHDDRLVVLPEAAMHDFGSTDLVLGPGAQPLDGPFVEALGRLASKVGATIVGGMFERSDDPDRPFNTLVVLSPEGELLASYRKAYLYDSFGYRESARLCAGDGIPTVLPVGGLMLGLLSCYELRFPEVSRALIDAGADTLVVPAAWLPGPLKEAHWSVLLRARAIENTSYVVAADQCAPGYVGASQVVDPDGVVVAALGFAEGVLSARLDREVVDAVRRRNPSLANRRAR